MTLSKTLGGHGEVREWMLRVLRSFRAAAIRVGVGVLALNKGHAPPALERLSSSPWGANSSIAPTRVSAELFVVPFRARHTDDRDASRRGAQFVERRVRASAWRDLRWRRTGSARRLRPVIVLAHRVTAEGSSQRGDDLHRRGILLPRCEPRVKSDAVMTGAGTPSRTASSTVHRPSPESSA